MPHLSSRERMLAALRCQQPDHVPLIFNVFGFQPPAHLAWTNQIEQAQRWLSLGVDATLQVSVPHRFHPQVEVREWQEHTPGERWPLMVKEYHTPAGVLRQEVYRTGDWISSEWPAHSSLEEGIELFDDYNVPRSHKFLIETEQDVEKLRYLLHPLSDEEIAHFHDAADALGRCAAELGILLEGNESKGTDALTWLCGVDGMLFMAVDRPELLAALLDVIQEWDQRNLEILLDARVDLVNRRGWYEGTAFWSPALYRRFFQPRFKRLVDQVHQAGRLMAYKLTTGFMPLLEILVEIGYDAHYYIDPVMGGVGVDLRKVKSTFGERIAVIGGVNSPVTLERGSREEIRRAVFDAIELLGANGGLVLTPVDCISASTPWEKVQFLIEAWQEAREY